MIIARCVNQDEVKLSVNIELTIGEWKDIVDIISKLNCSERYFGPLDEILVGIKNAVAEFNRIIKLESTQ